MRLLAVISNIVLFAFTCLVLATDGLPRETGYIILSLLLLLIPIISLVLIFRSGVIAIRPGPRTEQETPDLLREGEGRSSTWTMMKTAAILGNIVMFGFAIWAIVSQYPHPEEEGVIAYTVVVLMTPVLSLFALTRGGARWPRLQAKRTPS